MGRKRDATRLDRLHLPVCRYPEQEGLFAEGIFGPFDAVMIAEDAELPAHCKTVATECEALKQCFCFAPSKDVPTHKISLQGHSCSTVTQFLTALYTDCLQLSSAQQAVELHQLASQLGCRSIMRKCDTQIITHTQTPPRGSSYAAALPWILAAYQLHVAGPHQLWAKNIAASYSKLIGNPLLQMLPKQLLYSVMMRLATVNRQQKLQHDNTMWDLMRKRSGRATCKETEMYDGSFVQLYHFFCDQASCRGHELRRTTTGLEESNAVHLQGSCHCSHAWLSHTDQCGKEQEEVLPKCMSNIRFEKIRVVDDTILEGGMPYVADKNEAYNSFTDFKENFDELGVLLIIKCLLRATWACASNWFHSNMPLWRWTMLLGCQQTGLTSKQKTWIPKHNQLVLTYDCLLLWFKA